MNSPSPNLAWSPIPVDIHDTPHISGIIPRSRLANQSGCSHVDQCVTKTITESADKQDILMDPNSSTPMERSTRLSDITAHISDQDSDSGGEVTSDCSIDSDQCEFGPNLSLPMFRYQFMRPLDRRCTYCGAYKGKPAKTIMECTRDGRKICLRCYPDCHRRHRKYFKECLTNYANDGDCD